MREGLADLVVTMDPAIVIVTVAVEGERDGCLVGFHAQCSIAPPRYAVWLSVANRTHALAQRATYLAVHLLGADDGDLAELFGGASGDDVDKLAASAWEPGPGGVPLLERCPSHFVGRVVEHGSGMGDHDLFVLDVVEVGLVDGSRPPLRLSGASNVDPGLEATERR